MDQNNDLQKALHEASNEADSSTNVSRRKLAKAALASPILASLATRPVWGTTCSISGMQSGNTSPGTPTECEGSGCTPGYWKGAPEAWVINTPYSPGKCTAFNSGNGLCKEWNGGFGTKFSDAFGCGPDDTMMDILQKTNQTTATKSGSYNTQLNHFIAALLNASAAPSTYGATAGQVITVVCETINGTGSFTMESLKDLLARMNEAGGADHCIYNNAGFCDNNEVSNGTECIPSCGKDQGFDLCDNTCKNINDVNVSVAEVLSGAKTTGDCPPP